MAGVSLPFRSDGMSRAPALGPAAAASVDRAVVGHLKPYAFNAATGAQPAITSAGGITGDAHSQA